MSPFNKFKLVNPEGEGNSIPILNAGMKSCLRTLDVGFFETAVRVALTLSCGQNIPNFWAIQAVLCARWGSILRPEARLMASGGRFDTKSCTGVYLLRAHPHRCVHIIKWMHLRNTYQFFFSDICFYFGRLLKSVIENVAVNKYTELDVLIGFCVVTNRREEKHDLSKCRIVLLLFEFACFMFVLFNHFTV